MDPSYQHLYDMLGRVEGYIYPNEIELQWGILIVIYILSFLIERLL